MAKTIVNTVTPKGSVKRKGVHSKSKTSKTKKSKNYEKGYNGQGR